MKLKSFLIILLSCLTMTGFAQQKKVAVYVTGQQTGVNKVLGDKLVEAFAKSGKYIAIERTASFLAELGKEQNYQRTGAVDDNELSRLGKQFGVQLVCVADISEVFGQKYVSARLIDVESAEVVNSSNTNSNLDSMNELLKVSQKLATELTAQTVQEKAEEQAAIQKEQEELIKRLKKALSDGYIQLDNLMFVVSTYYPKMTYKRAEEAAQTMALAGYSDWRLPKTTEIYIIVDFMRRNYKICEGFPDGWGAFGCADNYYYDGGKVYKGYNTNDYAKRIIFVRDVKNGEQ